MTFGIRALVGVCMVLLCAATSRVQAQFSAFTYQGELADQDQLVDGLYDFRFELFDTASGGSPVAVTLCADNVHVVRGRFTVELDFGGLDMGALFIQISVRADTGLGCANTTGYTTLTPRQKIGISPFAQTSSFSLDTQLLGGRSPSFYNQASNLIGPIPSSSLSGTYSNSVTLSNSLNLLAGNGSGITALNATNLSQGTLPDARLSANVPLLNRTQSFTGNNTFTGPVIFGSTTTLNGATTFGSTSAFTGLATFNGGIAIPATARVLSIPAQGFKPVSTAMDVASDATVIRGQTANQSVGLDAPVQLPDGATITEFAAFVTDNDTAAGFTITLVRVGLASGNNTTVASVLTTTASASTAVQTLTDTTIAGAIVDNSQFAYYVRASWITPTPANMSVRGARIRYTMTGLVP